MSQSLVKIELKLKHVKQFRYICNNCVSYFPEKPWYLASELVSIDVGKGDLISLKRDAVNDLSVENIYFCLHQVSVTTIVFNTFNGAAPDHLEKVPVW